MRSCRSLIAPLTIVAAVVVAPHTLAAQSANAPPRPMSTAVREYLDAALDTLQRVSRHRDTFDWSALRDSVRVRAAGAQSIQDALPTLGWALRHVDRHSFLQPAAATPPAVSGRLVDERLGYILVPWFPGASRPTYIDSLQTMIRDFDTRGACGWIVDLRGNQGGNMWPMLAGIGPLLGDSIVGAFSIHGDLQPWFYVDGASWYVESGNRTGETKGSLPAHRPHPTRRVRRV